MSPRGYNERINDILERILRIRSSQIRMDMAEANQDWVLFDECIDSITFGLLIIGEAIKSIHKELDQKFPDVDWADPIKLRDLIAHHYYRIDAQQIREIIDEPLGEIYDCLIIDFDGSLGRFS